MTYSLTINGDYSMRALTFFFNQLIRARIIARENADLSAVIHINYETRYTYVKLA